MTVVVVMVRAAKKVVQMWEWGRLERNGKAQEYVVLMTCVEKQCSPTITTIPTVFQGHTGE